MDTADRHLPLREVGVFEGYGALRIDEATCPPALLEDIRGIAAARWLAGALRADFEQACYGAPAHGPIGTFDGAVSRWMPGHWRKTDADCVGVPIWLPDARHPVGKWFADVAELLPALPPPEVLDAVLRRHGLNGGREPAPQFKEISGGWAVLQHKPRYKVGDIPGVSRDDSLLSLWRGDAKE